MARGPNLIVVMAVAIAGPFSVGRAEESRPIEAPPAIEAPPTKPSASAGHAESDGVEHGAATGEHGAATGEHGTATGEHGAATGEHGAATGEHGAAHSAHHRFHVGAVGTALAVFSGATTTLGVGGGLFFEVAVIPEHLELKLIARALSVGEATELPIELLAKVPFHLTHWLHPFVEVGPSFTTALRKSATGEREVETRWGGAAAAGADSWVSRNIALVVEGNYGLSHAAEGWDHDLGGSLGALVGW